jgi:transposase
MGTVQNSGTVITTKAGQIRRFRSKQERRQIVEESLRPGASVALVARAHDVNANQVFKWRKQYQKGRLELSAAATLLPVKVSDQVSPRYGSGRKSRRRSSGIIDIDLGHARVRVEGRVDPDCLRAALEGLMR